VELLNVGADFSLANLQGETALEAACQRNMCSGVSTLLAAIGAHGIAAWFGLVLFCLVWFGFVVCCLFRFTFGFFCFCFGYFSFVL
jgi:hypothetical protein